MKNSIQTIIEKLESKRAFGNTPLLSIKRENGNVTVCRNDGQFHSAPSLSGSNGWATLIFHGSEAEFFHKFRNELAVM